MNTAAILAAGIGSRLRPLTNNQPKCLVKVNGKPILEHQLDALKKAGITKVIIVVGYEGYKIEQYCKRYEGLEIEIIYNHDYENTNNMYSMYLLRNKLKGREFLFCNADVIYDEEIIRKIVEAKMENWIAVDVGTYNEESMKVTVNDDGRITGISKSFSKNVSYGRSVDLYRLTTEGSFAFFNEIEKIIEQQKREREWTEVVIDKLASERKVTFKPLDIHGLRWVEIDNFDDLALADRVFSDFNIDDYKAVFLDLDGTLIVGGQAIEGAKDFIEMLLKKGINYYYVTNNSSRSKKDYVKKLNSLGLHALEENIILSTDGLVQYLLSKKITRVYCLGTESMKCELLKYGIVHDDENPQCVVVGYDTELTYQKLRDACKWINKGLDYYLTHKDVFCPSEVGPIPDAGAILKSIVVTTGRKPRYVFGKPNPHMLSHLIDESSTAEKYLFIGDRLYTDKTLADRLKIDFALVLTGETTRSMLQAVHKKDWPKLIIRSIADICQI